MNVLVCKPRARRDGIRTPSFCFRRTALPTMLTGPTANDIEGGAGPGQQGPLGIYFLSFKKKREKLNAPKGRKNK